MALRIIDNRMRADKAHKAAKVVETPKALWITIHEMVMKQGEVSVSTHETNDVVQLQQPHTGIRL